MSDAINSALFGWYPYLCLTVFLLGSLVRFDREQYTWKTGSSQLLRKRQLRWGSNLFHVGILVIFLGHAGGLLTPIWVFDAIGISHSFKQGLAITAGGIAGVMCFIGISLLAHRRLFDPRIRANSSFGDTAILLILWVQLTLGLSTIFVSLQHMDGHEMVKFMNWAQGILTLQPSAAAYVADVSLVFKAHLLLGMTIFLVFPFTRLVHVWSAPVWYLGRTGYQVVRTRRPQHSRRPEASMPIAAVGPVAGRPARSPADVSGMTEIISHRASRPVRATRPDEVSVNGVIISRAEIAREIQNHQAGTPAEAWHAAARALVVRELLLAEADRIGIPAEPATHPDGARETDEEATIRALLAREVRVPKADTATCRRHFERNRGSFRTGDLFEVAHILIPAGPDDGERRYGSPREGAGDPRGPPVRTGGLCGDGSVALGVPLPRGGRKSSARSGAGQTVSEFETALAGMVPGQGASRASGDTLRLPCGVPRPPGGRA